MRAHGKRKPQSEEREAAGRVPPASAPVQRMLALQRTAGNAAVSRAVEAERHAHGPGCGHAEPAAAPERRPQTQPSVQRAPAPSVQRTVWQFEPGSSWTDPVTGHQARWQSTTDPADVRTSAQLGIDARSAPVAGDTYDDATREVHSSANADFSRKGTVSDQRYPGRELQARRALVEAKQRIATALAMLKAAGDRPGGPLLAALHSGFPAFRTASPQQIAELLPRITEVVSRIRAGLNAEGAKIALAGRDAQDDPTVKAWVDPGPRDYLTRLTNPNQMKSEELPTMDAGRSGPIHLMESGQSAWYLVHEATHRFAGTLDYQYSPYEDELKEESFEAGMAGAVGPGEAAERDRAMIGKRAVRPPGQYTGQHESQPAMQRNWYALGRRALMNADSYAQFILTATGAPTPRT
ncbi:hypothetical protein [Streptomyces physcomitrii]|uniref:Lysine-specific metallo-endopeptidase domain-containing protein n=1 Tax=Streptomyces physcomitrii TaxID=2724184 RepID=A0ABX1GZ60_9ACTN|nr:hypothetical protein [Streptomyces physcomitrii]NKI41387.1 hypothetical protein [Streptomyces physcomitrii]